LLERRALTRAARPAASARPGSAGSDRPRARVGRSRRIGAQGPAAPARPAHRRGAGARLGAFRRCAARPRPGGGGAARGEGAAAAFRPAQPSRLEQLADVQSARKENRAAVASLRAASALVPLSPEPLRRLGGALELLGESKAAADARRAALRLAPGDLQLRQQIALDEGVRLLSWSDRDGAVLAKGSKDAPPGASAVRLLDSGAAQMYADGGGVERVHTVAR